MPLYMRIAVMSGIALICAGAFWLMMARGNAMMIDLSAAAARMLCL